MKYTFKQFQAEYPTDEACLNKIMAMKFGGTELICPACQKPSKFHRVAARRAYACQFCAHAIYPCVGTPFEHSSTSLSKWFFVMYLMTSTRHGVAAKEVERQLGVTYKCAWRMCHELRKLMANADVKGPLGGSKPVEIDETFVGGKHKGHAAKGGRGGKKAIVFGIVERDGNLRAGTIPEVKARTIEPVVTDNIAPGTTIYSDTNSSYTKLSAKYGFGHETVAHWREEWARGPVHVNNLEGHWSRLKASIHGTHIHVSHKHLWKYASEFSYRRNMRADHATMFGRLVWAFQLPHPTAD
ncbi:MAG: IS1595 family transposase [Terricaulis sp.]